MARPPTVLVKRHSLTVRITHWINVLSLWILLMSGLQIILPETNSTVVPWLLR